MHNGSNCPWFMKRGVLAIAATLALSPSAVFALEKGCEFNASRTDVFCRCGYRANASYPPNYSEYLQEGTEWEMVSMFYGVRDGDGYLSNGKKCEWEFYLYNKDKSKQKDAEKQAL